MKWYEELEDKAKVEDENLLMQGSSTEIIIRDREGEYPMLEICQGCICECKKHDARDLSFKCFDFRMKK